MVDLSMEPEIQRLKKVVAKAFRNAKKWYFRYVLAQLAVLAVALLSVFVDVDPRFSAAIAFIGVLIAEGVRWRSDFWKGEGDAAKRRWELENGLGVRDDQGALADWLAAKPADFLADVTEEELKGSDFESAEPPGARRLVENTEESAWWSKHESRIMAWYLAIFLLVLLGVIFVALTITISRLSEEADGTRAAVQNVGAIICIILAFVFSINGVKLLADFTIFYFASKAIVGRCCELLRGTFVHERAALLLSFDYQISRSAAPLLPTFIWRIHGPHLRSEWKRFRGGT